MKKLMVLLTFMFSILLMMPAKAQLGNLGNRVKDQLNYKVNSKIDQKTSQALDSVVDAPEKIFKKKEKKNKTKIKSAGTTSGENSSFAEGTSTVIQTNIKCESGKKKIISFLKKQDGIVSTDINTANGELTITYNSDKTGYGTILSLLNEQGVEADGTKPSNGSNPCKN